MEKNNQIFYKLIYYFLATVPHIIAFLFSFSVTSNIITLIQGSHDTNQLYVFALIGALIWVFLLVILKQIGAFANLGIHLNDFISDVVYILGYAHVAGVVTGLLVSIL